MAPCRFRCAQMGLESERQHRMVLALCSMSAKPSWRPQRKSSLICGGFFDVPGVKQRLGELDTLMAAETFWNNREQAQKLIDEASSLRKRIDPLFEAEKKLEDLQVMLELY